MRHAICASKCLLPQVHTPKRGSDYHPLDPKSNNDTFKSNGDFHCHGRECAFGSKYFEVHVAFLKHD
jgi:hypothetical protein